VTTGHSQSLERGLAILSAFKPGRSLLGITDLARLLDLNGATAHRYVATLAALGYLQQDAPTRKYRLGPQALDLGLSALGSIELRDIAAPVLREFSDRTGHTVNMAILSGTEIVYVERARSTRSELQAIDLDIHVGSRLPAYCTSMGKVLLAYLPREQLDNVLATIELVKLGPNTITNRRELAAEFKRVRANGLAHSNEELGNGLRSIAVPVRIHTGEVAAAINVHAHRTMLTLSELIARLGPPLREIADEISMQAGYRPPSS